MFDRLKLVLGFLVLAIGLSTQNDVANRMILTGVDCPKHFENVLCHNVICETQHVKDENPKISVGCEAIDVVEDVSFHYELLVKEPSKEYRSVHIANDVDFCQAMLTMTPIQMKMNIVFDTASKYIANVNEILHKCPFPKGWTTIKDFQTTDFFAPPMLQTGDYRVDFRIFNTKTNQTYLYPRFYFVVTPNRIAEMSV